MTRGERDLGISRLHRTALSTPCLSALGRRKSFCDSQPVRPRRIPGLFSFAATCPILTECPASFGTEIVPTGCKGRSIPMGKLDDLVVNHLERRLLHPDRLEELLASVLDRRQERSERRRQHIAELNKRITDTDQWLNRLYDAIEAGVAELDAPSLKDRIAGLKAIRDQAKADAERAQAVLANANSQVVSADLVKRFAGVARERLRLENGGYRRAHLRAFAQRIGVAEKEVRIMGSKSELLRTLVAASSAESAAFGVRSSVLKWRARRDSNYLVMNRWPAPFR